VPAQQCATAARECRLRARGPMKEAAVIALRGRVAPALWVLLASLASTADAADSGSSTATVLCEYRTRGFNRTPAVNATSTSSWRCDGASRVLSANGLPDHEVGSFPNPGNPFSISAQTVAATITLTPAVVNPQGARSKIAGYVLNGVKLDPGTAGTCNDSGTQCDPGGGTGAWRMEALGQSSFQFGTDANHAHVQPDGKYHYHGIPEGFVAKLGKGRAMTLIGWAMDGFPIYATRPRPMQVAHRRARIRWARSGRTGSTWPVAAISTNATAASA
jgi:YHYH protein